MDAYTIYILSALANPRMHIPKNIGASVEINKKENEKNDQKIIEKHCITNNDDKDRMHTETIKGDIIKFS